MNDSVMNGAASGEPRPRASSVELGIAGRDGVAVAAHQPGHFQRQPRRVAVDHRQAALRTITAFTAAHKSSSDADGDDVVRIVGDAGGDGPAFQSEAADEPDCRRRGGVAVDDRDLEHVVASDTSRPCPAAAECSLIGDELRRRGLDHASAGPICDPEVGSLDGSGSRSDSARGSLPARLDLARPRRPVRRRCTSPRRGSRSGSSTTMKSAGSPAATGRPASRNAAPGARGRPQHVEHVVPLGDGPPHEAVDVAVLEGVGVQVVGAEHARLGVRRRSGCRAAKFFAAEPSRIRIFMPQPIFSTASSSVTHSWSVLMPAAA